MLSFAGRRIWLARAATDMRRGVNKLCAQVVNELGEDPYQGDAFVFLSRDRRRAKILVWDASGFWLCAKRLERGRYARPLGPVFATEEAQHQLSPAELQQVLEGIQVHRATYHAHFNRAGVPDLDDVETTIK